MYERLISLLEPHNKNLVEVVVPYVYIRCHEHQSTNRMQYRTAIRHTQGVFNCPECARLAGRRDAQKRYEK